MQGDEFTRQLELQRAMSLFQSGNLPAAREALRAYVKRNPGNPLALHVLGIIAAKYGDLRGALKLLDRSASLAPEDPAIFANRGNVLRELKQPEEALRSYEKAIELSPNFEQAHSSRGAVLAELGRPEQALSSYSRAISLNPEDADTYFNLANAYADLRRFEEAERSYDKATALDPANARYQNNLGAVLADSGAFERAVACYDRALAMQPEFTDAQYNRGLALQQLGQLAQAKSAFESVLRSDPAYPYVRGRRLHVMALCCDWHDYARNRYDLRSDCLKGLPGTAPFEGLALYDEPEVQYAVARTWCQKRFPRLPPPLRATNRATGRRIRVAYLSSDFREHAVSFLIAELLALHDRTRFEIHAISWGPSDRSEFRERIERSVDRFSVIDGSSDRDAARMIAESEIDIAVDLNGYTAGERTAIFALRPAPVQINYLGFPGTMATNFVDYIIADGFVIPANLQRHYAEKMIYLPASFQANDSKRHIAAVTPSRVDAGLPEDGFVFCCFSNGHKMNPDLFDVWMRLLAGLDKSVLWLVNHNQWMMSNLVREAENRGILGQRLVFAPKVRYSEHLARYRLADLCLDTFPFNGGTTTSDALWAGVPVLTCAGRSFSGRMSGSLLRALGVPELITYSLNDYEALAFALASDSARLEGIRATVARNRLQSPLFDSKRLARDLDAAYVAVWERFLEGRPPTHIGTGSLD